MWKYVSSVTFNREVTGNQNMRKDSDSGVYSD